MNTEPETDPKDETAASEEQAAAGQSQPDLASEVEKYKDAALRARAELDNYRKRVVREKEEAIRYANGALLEDLLPVLENFELGLGAAKNATDAAGIVMGLEMVRKQLEDFLRNHGVETIDATGAAFDPNLHDAMAHEASADVPEGTVIRQTRKGFKLKDRLIRPASVVVSKGSE
jgi:molecular chaperone GrpE